MSHVIEEFSKCLGTTPSQPVLESHFFPMVAEKYITVETAPPEFLSLNYSYWESIVSLIKKYHKDVKFIDVTHAGKSTHDCFDQSIAGGCSYRQLSYIISKAQYHISVDSYTAHIASIHDIPATTLHSHLPASASYPVWFSSEDLHTSISPQVEGKKPCYSKDDPEGLINYIKPEDVAKSVLNKLGIKHELDKYKTLNIGKYYKDLILEIIPDFEPENYKQEVLINLRCDYHFDLDIIKKWLNYKVNLMIDKPIPIEVILKHRSTIAGLTIFIKDKSITPSYINQLNQARLKFGLVCDDKDILPDIRLKFFGTDVEEYLIKDKKDLDFTKDICDNSYYYSNKTLISKNKKYKSKAHWKHGEKLEDESQVIDCPDFWEEVEHFNIYNNA